MFIEKGETREMSSHYYDREWDRTSDDEREGYGRSEHLNDPRVRGRSEGSYEDWDRDNRERYRLYGDYRREGAYGRHGSEGHSGERANPRYEPWDYARFGRHENDSPRYGRRYPGRGDYPYVNPSSEAYSRGYARLREYQIRDPYESSYDWRGEERPWWDRASDAIASWFGDEEAERRRQWDQYRARHHRGRGPRGYTRSDERITEDINDRMTYDYFLDATDILVSVEKGEVTLSGTVQSRAEKRVAEDIAEDIPGVINVQNNIRVSRRLPVEPSGTGVPTTGTTGTTQAAAAGSARAASN
jgi:osmotically-inducible protein OsmY